MIGQNTFVNYDINDVVIKVMESFSIIIIAEREPLINRMCKVVVIVTVLMYFYII